MRSRPQLKLGWCSHGAAKYAVLRWHYSRAMPASRLAKIGVWEDDRFVGCVLFGHGASAQIGKPYNLKQTQVCELVRVAFDEHVTPTSRIVAIALRLLKRQCPGLRLVVSYADSGQGHHGGIYQAGGWIYVGESVSSFVRVHGRVRHRRSLNSTFGTSRIDYLRKHVDPNTEQVINAVKYKYLMPLDDEMRRAIEPLRKPYPKRVGSDTR